MNQPNDTQKVWVVTCEQSYADNYFAVVGVCSTEEKAKEMVKAGPDRHIENYYIDREW